MGDDEDWDGLAGGQSTDDPGVRGQRLRDTDKQIIADVADGKPRPPVISRDDYMARGMHSDKWTYKLNDGRSADAPKVAVTDHDVYLSDAAKGWLKENKVDITRPMARVQVYGMPAEKVTPTTPKAIQI